MSDSTSRFEEVSRRRFMRSSLAIAGLAALEPLLAACANSDAKTFAQASTTTQAAASTTAPGAQSASTTTPGATAPASSATPATPGSTAGSAVAPSTASGPAFPSGAKLAITFSFTPASSGGPRVNNPFIVVWIEDASGTLVKTVSLWYLARESRYVSELRRWYVAETASTQGQSVLDTVSGATRAPGAYSVVWDGTDDTGAAMHQGDYFVCVEAAREHGPYELIREKVTIGAKAFSTSFADQGELTGASAELTV